MTAKAAKVYLSISMLRYLDIAFLKKVKQNFLPPIATIEFRILQIHFAFIAIPFRYITGLAAFRSQAVRQRVAYHSLQELLPDQHTTDGTTP